MIYLAGTDFSHLTDEELLNGIKALQIPDYIRTKSYGVDVRETLAQMAEMLMQLAYNQGMDPQEAQDFVYRINNKIDKGNVTMSDLTQEVKEALTGGAVAVVGVDAVGTENIQDGAVTLQKTDFLTTGKNLFDRDKALEEHIISTNTGQPNATPGAGGIVSDFIAVLPGEDYFYTDRNQTAVNVIFSYDAQKNPIVESVEQSVKNYTTHPNASYVRFYTTGVATNIQFELGTKGTPYEPFGYEFNKRIPFNGDEIKGSSISGDKIKPRSIDSYVLDFINEGKNKFNKRTRTIGSYISNNSGEFASSSSYDTTDFIFVEANQTYITSHRIRKYLFYDLNKTPDPTTYVDGSSERFSFTPSSDGFIKISFWASDVESFQIEQGSQTTTYEPYRLTIPDVKSPTEINTLSGKTIANAGDSIAAGEGQTLRTYGKIIADKNDMIFQSWAVHGASLGEQSTRGKITEQIDAIVATGIQYDYVLINGGTNDSGSPLGTITTGYNDALDKTSVAGGLEYIFKTLREKLPKTKILFIRVHNMSSRTVASQKNIGEQCIEVCKKWSVPVVDLFNEGQLNTNVPVMKSNYTLNEDGTHPTYEGYDLFYVPPIEDKMRSI